MQSTKWKLGIVVGFALQAHAVCGAEYDKERYLRPVVLDSQDAAGASIGLEYRVADKLEKNLDSSQGGGTAGSAPGFGSAILSSLFIGYEAKGTVASSKERNPKNFLEFNVDASYMRGSSASGYFFARGFAKYETDQSFDNKQAVYGGGITYTKRNVPGHNDFLGIDLNYGRIDPKDDADRKAALGSDPLNSFYRWDAEAVYQHTIGWKLGEKLTVDQIELNYRYFKEISPPSAVKSAGLDVFRLGTVRVSLGGNLFLAYSRGKLPFDKKDDKIFEIGFSYKLD